VPTTAPISAQRVARRAFNLSELLKTLTLDKLMHAAAIIGFNAGPPKGISSPAATGMQTML
jgi:hypothetical protein